MSLSNNISLFSLIYKRTIYYYCSFLNMAESLAHSLSDHKSRARITPRSICQEGYFLMISVWWRCSQVSEVHTTPCEWNWVAVGCCACTKSHVIPTEILSGLALPARLPIIMEDALSLCCSIIGWRTKIKMPAQAEVMRIS